MSKRRKTRRGQQRRFSKRAWALGLGIGVLALALVAAFLFLSREGNVSAQSNVNLDKSKGEGSAAVTVVVYGDYQCPACKRFVDDAERQLEEGYVSKGQVRLAFRHMAFLGNESRWAAEGSECANEQGRFWDYHDRLYERQEGENVGTFSKENLQQFAAELGLNATQFNQCLASGQYMAKVQQETAEGRNNGVRSTPTVFVNGQLIDGGSNYGRLRSVIEAALGKE